MSRATGLERELLRLRAGEINWATFLARTGTDWERMGADIAAAWQIPAGVDRDDVRQELLLAVVEKNLLGGWDPTRGNSLSKYVVWQAYTQAKRFVHRQRAALRRDGNAPSRHPLPFSSFAREGDTNGDRSRFEGIAPAVQEEDADTAALADGFAELLGCDRQRAAFDALRETGGDEARAALLIWNTPKRAIACRVGSETEAARLVLATMKTLEELVSRVLAA